MRSLPHKTIASAKRSCVPQKLNQPARARDRIPHSHTHLERDDHVDPRVIEPCLGELTAREALRIKCTGLRLARATRERTSRSARNVVPPPFVPTATDAIIATA